MSETTDDAAAAPWPWRGVAWVVAVVALLLAWGAYEGKMTPDPLIVEYMARPSAANPLLALFALALANWASLTGLAMGLRFRRREKATPDYRAQANVIIILSITAGLVTTWVTLSAAWRLSAPWR